MSERQKQTVFLKRLLQNADSEQRMQLQKRIARAEQDERCVRLAMQMVGVLGLLCVAGLCYSAVFVDDFFINPSHMMTRILAYLGLGSSICWVMFLAYWFWHRELTNRLYEEGRRMLIARVDHSNAAIVRIKDCLTGAQTLVLKQDTPAESDTVSLSKAA